MPVEEDSNAKAKKDGEVLEQFLKIGLDERTAQNVLANSKVTVNLLEVIREAEIQEGCGKATGNLLYTVSTKYPTNALEHRPRLLKYVISNKIKSNPQLEAAFGYLSVVGSDKFDADIFEDKCGIGIDISPDVIKVTVERVLQNNMELILAQRYRMNVGGLLGQVRELQPWADGKIVKEEMDTQLKKILGERLPEDEEKLVKKKKEKKPKAEETKAAADTPKMDSDKITPEDSNPFAIFPKPQENITVHTEIFFSDGSIWRPRNSREKLQKHLYATGGKVFTRFPPEPNGYLHVGHAKETGGYCYLRYDDTNPDAEKLEYIEHIQEIIGWMGWKPFKVGFDDASLFLYHTFFSNNVFECNGSDSFVLEMQITFSSDYFQELYDLAVQLIKRGHAYVDHQTSDEIKEYREKKLDSPWRDRPVAESLKLFDDMRRGMIEEGKATLRMKQDMKNDNFNMYDLIAYRIKFTTHPHAGDKWCIYPSYDYTHCIVDSLENITHSLCTLEFESRRASYYWLLEALDMYLPYVWEYSRLNVSNTVLSKRKLNRLVTENWVDGWDDPRLMTLAALRRRGASPEALNAFCRGVGITRSDNIIRMDLLEHFIRDDLNKNARRSMVVLNPLKVIITNFKDSVVEELEAKSWPEGKDGDPSSTYKVPLTRVVYIEKSDFRLVNSKEFYGLSPGKSVLLRYAYPIKCIDVIFKENTQEVIEIHAEYDQAKTTKPKGVLHWVAEPSAGVDPLKIEVRLFDKLFLSENPGELDDWLADLNPNSKVVIEDALAVPALKHAKIGDKFQFERIGYFCVDRDTTAEKLVFNRTVTLRSSYPKDLVPQS
ncbi:hypothetical protein O6H91_15G069300 [Diphasiastrum complanatum]|uniref:Uncharacterized protein n=1 Tax=Diphasiastrum complanatum TaxID=34168 RepID=A0ACC2BJF6_DIPCM|nr:hypothetical protein O6H91_15G069300 [Diphasiastrum complanatum]